MNIALIRLLQALSALAITVGAWASRQAFMRGEGAAWRIPPAAEGAIAAHAGLGDVVRLVVATDPFRFDRRPSSVPFGQVAPVVAAPLRVEAAPPSVTGIVGPPWRASIEGIAGIPNALLLAAGDTIGGLRIATITRDTVVISAADRTWRLPVRRP